MARSRERDAHLHAGISLPQAVAESAAGVGLHLLDAWYAADLRGAAPRALHLPQRPRGTLTVRSFALGA
jgi:hypothetical protein